MISKVEAVRGWEGKMRPLSVVSALWGNEPEVPAARVLKLVSAQTGGRTGGEIRVLSMGFMLRRMLAAAGRLISGHGLGVKELNVGVVEPPAGL